MECVRIFGDSILRGVLYENGGYHLCRDRMNVPGVLLKNECRMGADSRKGLALTSRAAESCNRDTLALLEFGETIVITFGKGSRKILPLC